MRFAQVATLFVAVVAVTASVPASGQFIVDCTGNTAGAYTTINSVIPNLNTDWVSVQVTGPCQENVWLTGVHNVSVVFTPGQTANLQGMLGINASQNVRIQGLNVTSPGGNGITIMNSSDVELDSCISNNNDGAGLAISSSSGVVLNNCTSNNNSGTGLSVSDSTVSVQNGGAFNNNGSDGISVGGASDLGLSTWEGPGTVSVSNNVGDGIYLEDGVMLAAGGVVISNNKAAPGYNPVGSGGAGYGINVWGHGRGYVLSSWATDTISGNQAGGIAVHEGSEMALGALPTGSGVATGVIVDGNGPVGVTVGLGSQVSMWSGVQITNHPDAGVDVYGNSQVIIDGNEQPNGTFQIANNGNGSSSTYPTRAGVRVDGNSEAYIRAGQISQNGGPGILALANSSIDLSGATFASNSGGAVACDSSSWLTTNQVLPQGPQNPGPPCKAPNGFGPNPRHFLAPHLPLSVINQLKAQ